MFLSGDNAKSNMLKILELLKSGEAVSGEAMSRSLGVSRNAVWKQVQNLRDLGYEIQAETNVGYRLNIDRTPDKLYPFRVFPKLHTKKLGKAISWDYELPSTNDKAQELAKEGAEEGTLVLAETQTQGRGRRGRTWQSDPSLGIYLSVILKPVRPLAEAAPYTFLGAYTVLRLCIESGLSALVKWPNDIYVEGKKISGILTELSAIGQDIGFLVLGIGLNVNQLSFPAEILATSLRLELGKKLDRSEVLAKLLLYLEEGYERLAHDATWLVQVMRQYSLLIGKEVIVTGGMELEGIAEDIDDSGALLVRVKENNEESKLIKVWAGDVSVRQK